MKKLRITIKNKIKNLKQINGKCNSIEMADGNKFLKESL
jgi:hypothetical protein